MITNLHPPLRLDVNQARTGKQYGQQRPAYRNTDPERKFHPVVVALYLLRCRATLSHVALLCTLKKPRHAPFSRIPAAPLYYHRTDSLASDTPARHHPSAAAAIVPAFEPSPPTPPPPPAAPGAPTAFQPTSKLPSAVARRLKPHAAVRSPAKSVTISRSSVAAVLVTVVLPSLFPRLGPTRPPTTRAAGATNSAPGPLPSRLPRGARFSGPSVVVFASSTGGVCIGTALFSALTGTR